MSHLIVVYRNQDNDLDPKLELHRSKFLGGFKLVKTYPIAVGRVGLETSPGRYKIINKSRSPHLAYQYPTTDWVPDELKGVRIPDGDPRNPIAARWMGLSGNHSEGIHGTFERESILGDEIGSHGCVRMLVEDVVHLYAHAPKKTPVFIY